MNRDLLVLLSPESVIIFILVLSRISGLIASAPLFSTFPIPVMVKVGLSALVSFVMYPFVSQNTNFYMPDNVIVLSIMVFKEVFVGILTGFCANLVFTGIMIGGQLLSMQMGLTMAESFDPSTHQRVPVVGQLYLFIASMIFIQLNGHQWLFSSIYDSYNAIPIGISFEFSTAAISKILYITSQLFNIAFRIIMPIFGVLFVTDIALAFMAKIMPQMNIFMVGIPLKIFVGLVLMSLFMTTTSNYLINFISDFLLLIQNLFV